MKRPRVITLCTKPGCWMKARPVSVARAKNPSRELEIGVQEVKNHVLANPGHKARIIVEMRA